MHVLTRLVVLISCSLTALFQKQVSGYAVQRRLSHRDRELNTSATVYPFYKTPSNSVYKKFAQRNSYPYSSSTGLYRSYERPKTNKPSLNPYSSNSLWDFINHTYEAGQSRAYNRNSVSTTQYSNASASPNSKVHFSRSHIKSGPVLSTGKKRVSKADAENSKFAGAENQEDEGESRTLWLKRKKILRRFHNRCFPYGRDAGKGATLDPKGQGRFLWDVNVYNVYPHAPAGLGCGYGGFGGGVGSGLLSDAIGPAYYPPAAGVSNLWGLFAPGILQNSLAVTAPPPQQFADYSQPGIDNDLQTDPEVDPSYRPGLTTVPVRRPNRVFYESVAAPAVTPGQIVGQISTTVNGIIQQLTGNVQPVYG